MSTSPSSVPPMAQPPGRRLTLKLSTPSFNDQIIGTSAAIKEGSSSPVRPSYSPVTPTLPHVSLNAKDASQQWIDEPEPLPVSLDENPDAIALKAAISILQMQRQQTLRDIRDLDRTKQAAIDDPEAFVKDLREGHLHRHHQGGISFDNDNDNVDNESDDSEIDNKHEGVSRFGHLPNAQNVARCPPIEWTKYHITGDPLDSLHELQKKYPGLTEESMLRGPQPQPHNIAAPYRPFLDRITPHPTSSTERQFDH